MSYFPFPLRIPVIIKETNKQVKSLCWKVLDPEHLFFYTHWLCMSYIIAMPLLVNCMRTCHHLFNFARLCMYRVNPQNSQQKIYIPIKNFSRFLNHYPLLTMMGECNMNPLFTQVCFQNFSVCVRFFPKVGMLLAP